MSQHDTKNDKCVKFVQHVIERIQNDTGFRAALTRADNPATEYQSWEHLVRWCDIDKSWERIPYTTIAAGIARAKPRIDGNLRIGTAIAGIYDKGSENEAAKGKLRRLLACTSNEEACKMLRSILPLIHSKGVKLSYAQLLRDLLYFRDKVSREWAISFYRRREEGDSK